MTRHHSLRTPLSLGILVILVTALTLPFMQSSQASHAAHASTLNLTQYVNPFIGTAPGGSNFGFGGDSGDTFPGASYPMGMMQWSPDTTSNLPGGYYYPDNTIKGFSLTHFSGRGCTANQDIPIMPYVGSVNSSPATNGSLYQSTFSHSSEVAQPGYYKTHLDGPNVTAELTVGRRTGMGQFTYPASYNSTIIINTGGSINGSVNASTTISTSGSEVSGSETSTVGCGGQHYTLYFVAQFDHTFTSWGTWNGGTVSHGSTSSSGGASGAFVTFGTNHVPVLHIQVGISYVSINNARANLTTDNTPAFNFNAMRANTNNDWNARLNTIQVQGGSNDEKTTFYTALYHAFFHPNRFSDENGQYLGFDGQIHSVAQGTCAL